MASHLLVPPTVAGRVLEGLVDVVVAWTATLRVKTLAFWVKHRRALAALGRVLLECLILADIAFVVALLVLNDRHGEAMVIATGAVLIPAFAWAWRELGQAWPTDEEETKP